MAQVLYLHVGAPKTGTSYLQEVIWTNRGVLREAGIELPLGQRRKQLAACAHLRDSPWATDMWRAGWQELASAINAIEGTALVSEEVLCRTPPERIGEFLDNIDAGTEVHVVYGARDPGRQIPAMWQHLVRARGTVTFGEYLAQLRRSPNGAYWQEQHPVHAWERWGPFVESGRFHLITVPGPGGDPSVLWQRFAGIIGAGKAEVVLPDGLANESLGVVEAELLRRVNGRLGDRFPMRRKYFLVIRGHLIKPALSNAPDPVRIRVPDEFAGWLSERAEGIVADIRALGSAVDVVGDLKDLTSPITTAGALTPDTVEAEALLDAMLDATVRQMEHFEVGVDAQLAAETKARADRSARAALPLAPLRVRAFRRIRLMATRGSS